MTDYTRTARRISRDTILIVLTKLPVSASLETRFEALNAEYPFAEGDTEGHAAWQHECMAMMGLTWAKIERPRSHAHRQDPNQTSLF